MDFNTIKEFPITVYSISEKYSPTISRGRCKIFYKYKNRNGSYITDEFAEKLIKTLPYTPIKGIYDKFEEDYTDHGDKRSRGRIYGVVPENHHFAWEKHLDEDGVERTYACADVFLYTALYDEAEHIIGKSQSMEIYEPSITGDWTIINGEQLFKYTEGCFLGLQALGDNVEPCFEGSSFFSLRDELKDLVKKIEEFSLESEQTGGQSEMDKLNFNLSDATAHSVIWESLNTNYNETGNYMVDYSVIPMENDSVLLYKYSDNTYSTGVYTKENETVKLGEQSACYVISVTEAEKAALEALREQNNGTYEKVNELYDTIKALEEDKTQFDAKIEELNGTVATLTTERDEQANNYATAQQTISDLNGELETLKQFKAEAEKAEKETVVDSYSELLSEEVISTYKAKLDEYASAIELDKDLAYELKTTNPSVFSKNPQYLPKDNPLTGIEAILAKHKK